MSQRSRSNPLNWSAFERGRASSFGSLESVPEHEQQNVLSQSATPTQNQMEEDGGNLRRRRSSVAMRINQIRQMGGPNSIDNFAKSWQRAAGFREITPVRRNSITLGDDEEATESGAARPTGPSPQQKSLLRQQFEAAGGHDAHDSAIQDTAGEQSQPTEETSLLQPHQRESSTKPSVPGSLHPSSIAGSQFGQSFGSISVRLTASAQRRASILIQQQREASLRALEAEEDEYKEDIAERLVEQEVRPDGEIIERTVGESTVPMTIFNSTNVLIGVGILALPLAVKHAGWVIGLLFLTFAASVTCYTAKLLAKCLDTNSGSTTYGDIAFLAFGSFGRNLTESLFIVELIAANVALIILFADSMNSLMSFISVTGWKCIIALGLVPLNFVSFKILSVTSILGIISTLGILLIVFIDGFIKPHRPGSLRDIAQTYPFPQDWRTLPLSFGLFMAPWGGHSVFPAVYKDMRHPQKYGKALLCTYIFTYGLDLAMAVLGYLMFGDTVHDEVTGNILTSNAYPRALSVLIIVLIAIIPITKLPLSNRPIADTVNKKFLIDLRQMDAKARQRSLKSWKHRTARAVIAISGNVVQLGVSILFPDFDSIMALMGSALCFTICVILPISFYLRIFSLEGMEIGRKERLMDWTLIIFCAGLGITGTIFAILPKDKIGVK